MAAIQRIPCGYMFISYMADRQKQNIDCKIKRKVYSKLSFLFFTIVNISSVNAYLALDSQMCYTTSKGGVSQLTKVQAVALTPYNIKVNAICPGPIETELMRRVGSDPQLFNTVISRTPIGRIGTPNECGRLAVYLASEDSDFIWTIHFHRWRKKFSGIPGSRI